MNFQKAHLLPGFTTETWDANEALTIGFAYRTTARGTVILAQGTDKGEDPFNVPHNPDWPVMVCFIPAKYIKPDDELGALYTDPDSGHSTELLAPGIHEALTAASLILDN